MAARKREGEVPGGGGQRVSAGPTRGLGGPPAWGPRVPWDTGHIPVPLPAITLTPGARISSLFARAPPHSEHETFGSSQPRQRLHIRSPCQVCSLF